MVMGPPIEKKVVFDPHEGDLTVIIKSGAERKLDLLFFVSSDSIALHGKMKALEAEYQVKTQEMRLSSVRHIMKAFCRLSMSSRKAVISQWATSCSKQISRLVA